MTEKDNIERRKYARLNLTSKVTFSIVTKGEVEPFPEKFIAEGKNVGIEGILFTSDQKLKPGTILDLEIYLPYQSQPVILDGEVRWCLPSKEADEKGLFDTGVKFPEIKEDHVRLLIKHICGNLSADMLKKLNLESLEN